MCEWFEVHSAIRAMTYFSAAFFIAMAVALTVYSDIEVIEC